MERLVIDMVNFMTYHEDNDGFKYVLTAIDHFSSYAFGIPCKSKETVEIAQGLVENIFKIFGPWKILHSDNGGEFVSKLITEVAKILSIELINRAPYHPQSQGK